MIKIYLKFLITIILIYVCPHARAGNGIGKENILMLNRLDSVLENHQEIIDKKEFMIQELKRRLNQTRIPAKKLFLLRDLYEEYRKYDSDSAIFYAQAIAKLHEEIPENELLLKTESKISLARIYSYQGLFEEAESLLSQINSDDLPQDLKLEYYKTNVWFNTLKAMYVSANINYEERDRKLLETARIYGDSLFNTGDKKAVENYLWLKIAMALSLKQDMIQASDIEEIEEILSNDDKATYSNAENSYWLGKYYESIGNEDKYLYYLIKSAIYDALLENRDIASIREIGEDLLKKDDPERAYNYLTYALQQASVYHNRNRMIELSIVLPDVLKAYKEMRHSKARAFRGFIIALSILTLILIITVFLIIKEYKRKKVIGEQLESANHNLEESIYEKEKAIENLVSTQKQLKKSQEVELNMLTFTISVAAHYINSMDSFRKKLLTLYKSNKMKDIEEQLNNEELSKEKYSEFYRDFDNVILSIWPDIVSDYNKLVIKMGKPNFTVQEGIRELNTRLRIHALTLLGIDKSTDQAKILNLSIRTVYNNRLTTEPGN